MLCEREHVKAMQQISYSNKELNGGAQPTLFSQ